MNDDLHGVFWLLGSRVITGIMSPGLGGQHDEQGRASVWLPSAHCVCVHILL